MNASATLRDRLVHVPWKKVAIGVVALIAVMVAWHFVDMDAVRDWLDQLNPWLMFVVITALPLVGFPVTPLHVAAGMRWGPALGLGIVAGSILLQLLASYALVRLFRPLFEHRLERFREKIPQGAHGPVALFTALLPGVPYFAKNYTLPLIGVPLWTTLLWCFPLHAARASIAVIFGDQSDHLTPARIAGFCAYFAVVTLSCAWAFRRIKGRVGDRSRAAGGRKKHA